MSPTAVNPLWDEISVGFDASEETINFGTRAIAQSDTDIYETNTVATIKTTKDELLEENPNCIARFSSIGISVSVDNTWILFNSSFSELIHQISFESNIDTFEISEDGCFIFIALENGFCRCFCPKLEWKLLFSKEIECPSFFTGKHYFSKIIVNNSEDGLDVYIIANTGKIIKVEGVDFNLLKNLSNEVEGDEILLNNLPLNPEFKFLETVDTSCDILSACALKNEVISSNYILWLCGKYLQTWIDGNNEGNMLETFSSFSENLYVTKIAASYNGDKVIGLTNKGTIIFFCPFTYLKLGLWSKFKVLDFSFVTNTINGNICTQLLLLIDSGVTELCLCDIKGFNLKIIYRLPLDSAISYLICEQFNCEDILFIEGYKDESKVNSLRIKTISISHPEFRLERLLQRGKFDDAKNFARIFSLDIELVHKAKIKWLMSRLQLWEKISEETLNSNFNELFTLLIEIKDLEFVADCCLKTVAPNLSKIQQLLEYAIDKISSTSSKSENLERLRDTLGVSLRTLGTFMLIYPGEVATPDKWFIFSSANPISLCKQHLSRGEVKEAILICSRHNRKIKNELAVNMAISLFEVLPLTVSVEETLSWYECYVPLLLRVHPQSLHRLTQRIIEKAKLLELSDNENWPDISLKFLTDMISLLERLLSLDDSSPEGVILHQGKCLQTSPVNQLRCMVTILDKLYVLKYEHSILISYDTFSNLHGSKNEEEFLQLTSLLFDYVPMEGIPSLIQDFVEPYCIVHHKDIDYIIYYYVADIVKKYSCCWDIESSLWESKCIAFANCIRNISDKIKVIEVIVRNAKVPWSAEVNEIAQKSARIKHPLAQTIKQYSKNVSKKVILNKYDLPLDWVNAPNMTALIPYIFKKGFDGMLEDALELFGPVNKLQVYECYLHHCIQENKLDEVMSLLRTFDINQCVELCDSITYSASLYFKNKFSEIIEPYLEVLPANSSLLSRSGKDPAPNRVKFILASYKIKVDYGVIVDSSELYKLEMRELALKYCLIKVAEGIHKINEQNETKLVEQFTQKTWTLTSLLELPYDLGLLELASIFSFENSSLFMNNVELSCKCLKVINENCEKNIGKENNFFKTHGERLRNFITALLNVIAASPQISTDVINIMCRSSELLVVEGVSRDLAVNTDLMNACQIFYVPPPKPVWYSLYDSTESFRLPLSPVICESLTQCLKNTPDEENNQQLQEEVERTMEEMPRDLVSLSRMTSLRTLLTKHRMIDMRTIKKAKNISIQTVSTVLLKVIKSRQLDMALAQSLLQFFQPDQAFKWLQNVSSLSLEVRHNRSLGLVGKQYCKLIETSINSDDSLNFFMTLYLNSKWALKLQQFGIPGREAYKADDDSKKNVMIRLMNIPWADISLFREYCADMKLDVQECLLLYLKLKLLSWKPRFTVVTNHFNGKSEPIYEKDDEVFVTCYGVAMQVTNQKKLIKYLTIEVWDNINPYYYEVFLVIIDILSNLSGFEYSDLVQQNYFKLHFLKSYNRISPCQEAESDFWFAKFPSSTSLPTIAQYRLPFDTLPYDIPKSLKPELSLETYERWIEAPFWPQCTPDTNAICLYTIYNLKDEEVSTISGWDLHEKKRDLLDKITNCIDRISNLESAVAAWYFVVNHVMPPGIDQVHAAQKCLLKAKEWVTKGNGEVAKTGYSKVEKKYFTVSTVHILYTYRLARPEYLSLVSQPVELISQLYQDPYITDNYNVGSSNNEPNINKAVESIASLHNVNLTLIIQELLTEWLQPDNSLQASFMESTMLSSVNSMALVNSNELTKTDNIFRACYVLLGCQELRNAENFLIGVAFPRNHDDTSKPIGVRLRALQVLTAITSTEHLEEITSRDKDSIGDYMTVLSLVYELDRHGLAYTISSFELASKENIIKDLLNRSDASGIKLAVRIALSYKINNSNLWNLLIDQMTQNAMVSELEIVLIEVDYLRINRNILSNAWNCVILSTLARGERINPEERKNLADKSYKLITSCPAFSLLDLDSIVNYFKKLERNDYAAIIENISKQSNKNI